MQNIVIAGASLAGINAARTLRRNGFDGTIQIVGAEAHLPYDRPPLSKTMLSDGADPTFLLGPKDDDLDLELLLGDPIESLDCGRRELSLGGRSLIFDGLIIATGARARPFPLAAYLDGVHTLRNLNDAMALRTALDAGAKHVAIIGAGVIGLEAAASIRKRGPEVTLIEPLPRPMARVLPQELGHVISELHRHHGVNLHFGRSVERFEGTGHVTGLELDDGVNLPTDLVIVGIGVAPNTEWLEGSGLHIDDGIVTDTTCHVAPGIVAAGDVARWTAADGTTYRFEHWDNAVAQGAHAAASLLAGERAEAFQPKPWFWSDQYDRKITVAGEPTPCDELRVIDGSFEEGRFVALTRRGDHVSGAVGMNRPAPLARWRMRLAEPVPWATAI